MPTNLYLTIKNHFTLSDEEKEQARLQSIENTLMQYGIEEDTSDTYDDWQFNY